MGSKMAAATRVVQAVKPHTPLIKFPDRKSSPRPKIQESLQASVLSPHVSKAQESVGGRPLAFQNISPVSSVHGAPDTSELARILPQKYRRKLMSVEEIEYIQFEYIGWEHRSLFMDQPLPDARSPKFIKNYFEKYYLIRGGPE